MSCLGRLCRLDLLIDRLEEEAEDLLEELARCIKELVIVDRVRVSQCQDGLLQILHVQRIGCL